MENHLSTTIHDGIKMLYKDQHLTDIVIRVGSQTFPCHKLVLSAVSPYFKAMFTGEFQDKHLEEVNLESIPPDTFKCILQYVYCSDKDVINEHNAQDILNVSCMLLIQHVQQACESFISEKLNTANVIKTWQFAMSLSCTDLQKSSKLLFLNNFEEVMKTDDFLALQPDELSEIVSDDDLNVSREEIVGDAVLRWFSANEDARQHKLYSVLQYVRLPLTPAHYIFHTCKIFPILSKSENLALLFDEARYFHGCGIGQNSNNSLRFSHRNSSQMANAMIYLCCSKDGTVSTYAYHFQKNVWKLLNQELRSQGSLFAACVYRNDVYFSGGESDLSGNMLKFIFGKNIWVPCASLGKKRFRHAMVATSGSIYLIGGSKSQSSVLPDIVQYDLSTNVYDTVGKLLFPVRSVDAVALEKNIFVFGGKAFDRGLGTTHIQCFDLNSRQCSKIEKDMPVPFIRSGALVVDGSVYLLSEKGDVFEWTTAETFDLKLQADGIQLNDNETPSKTLCCFRKKLYIACSSGNSIVINLASGSQKNFETPCDTTVCISMLQCVLPKSYFQ